MLHKIKLDNMERARSIAAMRLTESQLPVAAGVNPEAAKRLAFRPMQGIMAQWNGYQIQPEMNKSDANE